MPDETVPPQVEEFIRPVLEGLARYHHYHVVGLEHVPDRGKGLVVFTHSLATYDIILFGAAVYERKHRLIASLADRLIFKIPILSEIAKHVGALKGDPQAARAMLDAGRLVGVAPGGMREALRSKEARYQVSWQRRIGFARLALEAQAPVILAACPSADDIYHPVDNPLTRYVYERFRVPLPLAFGRAGGPLPKPVRLTHFVAPPIVPPAIASSRASDAEAHAFRDQLEQGMQALIACARLR